LGIAASGSHPSSTTGGDGPVGCAGADDRNYRAAFSDSAARWGSRLASGDSSRSSTSTPSATRSLHY
jgi:hypothetical protein